MCVLDVLAMKVKTGISHWRLRPTLAVVDLELTMTLPPEVTAASGMDIVCHAVESYTARPYTAFARKAPEDRVTYRGANPVSDLWCEKAMTLIARSFRRAVHRGADDVDARSDMMLAATFAGMGFGNAGVHLPHANGTPLLAGCGLPARRLPVGRADGSARAGGVADGARGVPVLLRRCTGAAPRAAELLDPAPTATAAPASSRRGRW